MHKIKFNKRETFSTEITKELLQKAAETNHPTPTLPTSYSKEEKISLIEEKMSEVLQILGLDLDDESLYKTPYRIAKMYVEEIFSGLDPENFPSLMTLEDPASGVSSKSRGMILSKNIALKSFCEHHFVPFIGTAHVAYIPNGRIIGLSKINRLVNYFSRRPQIQERLTAQIADALSLVLDSEDIAVSIEAQHHCLLIRGVEDSTSSTLTRTLRGRFEKDSLLRSEFFNAIN